MGKGAAISLVLVAVWLALSLHVVGAALRAAARSPLGAETAAAAVAVAAYFAASVLVLLLCVELLLRLDELERRRSA